MIFQNFVRAIIKAAGHRYIKRIPYTTPKGRRYRYIYRTTSTHRGRHAFDPEHLVENTKFALHGEGESEFHGHITDVEGDTIKYVIDDGPRKGEEVTTTRAKLVAELNDVHGVQDKLVAERAKVKDAIAEAKRAGHGGVVRRLERRLRALGGEPEPEARPVQEAPDTKQPTPNPVERIHKIGSPRAVDTSKLIEKLNSVEKIFRGVTFKFKGRTITLGAAQDRLKSYGYEILTVKKNLTYRLSGTVARRLIKVNASHVMQGMGFTGRRRLNSEEINQFNEELTEAINTALDSKMPGIGEFRINYDGEYKADLRAADVAAYAPQTEDQQKLAEEYSKLETLMAVKDLNDSDVKGAVTAYANTAAAAGHLRKELNKYPEFPRDPSTYTQRAEWGEGRKALERRYYLARELSDRFWTLSRKRKKAKEAKK